MSRALEVLLLVGCAQASEFLAPGRDIAPVSTNRDGDLRNMMKSMMSDDDDDASDDTIKGSGSEGGFLQTADNDGSTSTYVQESANALSSALGSRWNGKELERNADESRDSLLKGIANPKGLAALNGMLHAIR